MSPTDHENFATDLLFSLSDEHTDAENLRFVPNPAQSRNAAKAMMALLCHRIFQNSEQDPIRKTNTTYEWKNGTFNCRNIADRDYLWTNMRRGVANEMHD